METNNTNVLDLLLGLDTEKVKKPTREVEITRLSALAGSKVTVICEAVSMDKFEELKEQSVKVTGKGKNRETDIDMADLQIFLIMDCVKDMTGNKLFRNKELMKRFSSATPKELVKNMLLSGEINAIYDTISDLSGFNDTAVQEVKN